VQIEQKVGKFEDQGVGEKKIMPEKPFGKKK